MGVSRSHSLTFQGSHPSSFSLCSLNIPRPSALISHAISHSQPKLHTRYQSLLFEPSPVRDTVEEPSKPGCGSRCFCRISFQSFNPIVFHYTSWSRSSGRSLPRIQIQIQKFKSCLHEHHNFSTFLALKSLFGQFLAILSSKPSRQFSRLS
jgi:hypothetical protein